MYRRRALAVLATALLPAAGCLGGPTDAPDGATATARSETGTPESMSSPTPRTTTERCDWPNMCAGSTLLELFVDTDYEHTVTLRLGCRSTAVTVDPGRHHAVTREEDGEECDVVVSASGEDRYETVVSGAERVTLRIDETGEVDVSVVVL